MREHQPLFLLVATDRGGGGIREMEEKDTKREGKLKEGKEGEDR